MRSHIAGAVLGGALIVPALIAGPAVAQGGYPAKTIRWIVPWPPGGGADVLSRMLSPKLSEALKQQIVIDNRGGAAGNIGAEMAAKSPPDGYTIVFAYSGTHAINPSIYSRMPFKESDFAPIILLASVPQVLVVHPSLPVKNVKELIALAKKRPGQLTYGSSGNGAFNHLTGALFASMAKIDIVHVPYKGGGPAAVALLSGEITMILGEPASIVGFVKVGKVRALAVTGAKRALGMPELPTLAEAGIPGYAATSWNGMLAPAGVPAPIIKRLNEEFNRIISDPEIKPRMLGNGYEPIGGSPEKFGAHIHAEIAKWAPVVKATGVKVD
ncbi:MAG TPA: tripartite tricarboxylate transporter substrate binding protein [Burkholderiales bacterium]|jgi:tripartite-type tricarboxylate transporter receptor subunit TctC|nr:tripartite tricarboxylate transporter substrate binding protein [Burkholderiales bacterium]